MTELKITCDNDFCKKTISEYNGKISLFIKFTETSFGIAHTLDFCDLICLKEWVSEYNRKN
jgi:hypothetical protein